MSGDNATQVSYYLIEFYIHTSKNINLKTKIQLENIIYNNSLVDLNIGS